MVWDTANTLQVLGVAFTAAGVGAACYERRRIKAITRWIASNLHALCARKKDADNQKSFQLPELSSCEESDVEANAATSAWVKEARSAIYECCA